MNALQDWFLGLERREQWLLLLLVVLLSGYLLLRLAWEPMTVQRALLERQNHEVQQTLVWMRSSAAQVRLQRQRRGRALEQRSPAVDLSSTVQSSAAAQRLNIKRLQPQADGSIRVRMEDSDANRVLSWLHALEQKEHAVIQSLDISNTRQAGSVNLSVELR